MRGTSAVNGERAAGDPGPAAIWSETRCLRRDPSYMRTGWMLFSTYGEELCLSVSRLYSLSPTFLHLCEGLDSFSDLDFPL